MKRKELAPKAQQLYVYEQLEFKEIAAELGVSERTIRTWAKQEDWQAQRKRYLRTKEATKSEFLHFVQTLLHDVRETLDLGEEPSRTKVNLLSRFGYMLLPPSDFRGEQKDTPSDAVAQDPVELVKQFLEIKS